MTRVAKFRVNSKVKQPEKASTWTELRKPIGKLSKPDLACTDSICKNNQTRIRSKIKPSISRKRTISKCPKVKGNVTVSKSDTTQVLYQDKVRDGKRKISRIKSGCLSKVVKSVKKGVKAAVGLNRDRTAKQQDDSLTGVKIDAFPLDCVADKPEISPPSLDISVRLKRKQAKRKKPARAIDIPKVWTYEESDVMARYEGYWVRRSALSQLEERRQELQNTFAEDRLAFQRAFKKVKRVEHKNLVRHLIRSHCRPELSLCAADKSTEMRMVRFDGILMPADAVGRLKDLRTRLRSQHLSEQQQRQLMKQARRREEDKHKRAMKQICLFCRKPGHKMSQCAFVDKNTAKTKQSQQQHPVEDRQTVGICFRCGSAEHKLSECTRTPPAGSNQGGVLTALPFARCFVCGESGHLARDCKQNANGIYPNGGACRVCGSKRHLAAKCPRSETVAGDEFTASEKEEEDEEEVARGGAAGLTLATIDGGDVGVEDDYDGWFSGDQKSVCGPTTSCTSRRACKVVKF